MVGGPGAVPAAGPCLPAILVIEFIYAIVGIVWLTQYYTSCNDLTAKNVTLGTAAPARAGREGAGAQGREGRFWEGTAFLRVCTDLGTLAWGSS